MKILQLTRIIYDEIKKNTERKIPNLKKKQFTTKEKNSDRKKLQASFLKHENITSYEIF